MNQTQYDLFSPTFKKDPFTTFAHMRANAPIYANVAPNGITTWYVTRYDDVLTVLRDNDNFVKDVRNSMLPEERPSSTRHKSIQQHINENMLFSDPPDHTRLRALVTKAFTPRRVEQMKGRVQIIADGLLDEVADAGEMDVIVDFALPLPVIVICEMLGIPQADQDMVASWSQSIISPGSRGLGYRERKRKMRAFIEYLGEMFVKRQHEPEDDLITALVQAEDAGERLNEAELSSMVALLLVTGHETTVNLIGNGALALLQNPAQLQLVMENEGLMDTAVEELLRFDGPVETSTTRWVRHDCEFMGQQLKRGDIMRVSLASANRDQAHFENSDQLDVTRQNNKHLAFGHGIHYCLGAPLARLEGKIALRTLFTRFPSLALKATPEQLQWRSGVLFRGLETFPVKLG